MPSCYGLYSPTLPRLSILSVACYVPHYACAGLLHVSYAPFPPGTPFLSTLPLALPVSGYFGVHLRTEADAATVGRAGYDQQASSCLEAATTTNSTLIYAASSDP